MAEDFSTYKNAIARIFDQFDRPVGVGSFIGKNLVLTCAHVVSDALGCGRAISF